MNRVLVGTLIFCIASLLGIQGKAMKNASRRQEIFQNSNNPFSDIGPMKQRSFLSPMNADAVNGAVADDGGVGLPFGTQGRRLDKNPLIGAAGLTKNSLADIMFGNLKGLASATQAGAEAGQNEGIAAFNAMQMQGNQQDGMGENMVFGGTLGDQNNLVNTISNGLGNGVNINKLAAMNGLIASGPGLNNFRLSPEAVNGNGGLQSMGGMNGMGLGGFNPNSGGMTMPQVNSFGGPPMEVMNPSIGLKMLQQMKGMQGNNEQQEPTDEQHHKRHHHHHHHHRHKHHKSTTKVLLSLLVDKLKDIYELDQMKAAKNQKLDSLTSGKIGDVMDALDLPKGDLTSRDQGASSNSTLGEFKTKLSFPLTVSDEQASKIVLKGKDVAKDDDDSNIQNILSNLGISQGSDDDVNKKSSKGKMAEMKNETQKNSKKEDPKIASFISEIKGQQFEDVKGSNRAMVEKVKLSNKNTSTSNKKAQSKDKIAVPKSDLGEIMKDEDSGSESEFHTIKAGVDIEDKVNGFSSSPLDLKDPSPPGKDTSSVSPLRTFSISSLLNNEGGTGDSDTGADFVKISDKPKISKLIDSTIDNGDTKEISLGNSVSTLPDVETKSETLESRSRENESPKNANESASKYLKAARVLGAVYKKVRDPIARDSVETAIKAMLKVIRYESKAGNSYKKHAVPRDKALQKELRAELRRLSRTEKSMRRRIMTQRKART
ncbi:serine/threonine-protein kinase PRP4 homolog [Nematostella vectensis]|uniref:serine/threonine-protein kinase PRP4 homolog n=1 Tax=Nematostella vectensis TaxID=45351 RepID=UPI00138FC5A6|nr:serine/threonine-protein kinase PRP4 homolog [Nematostella vectensis]XP_032241479.1 serine/threonine-protein kinase PRP4 homolog [Nematostella vectensis]XP_032241480.1 serine/threonine-protein kinase PRP4 homolog [Nematostella vectensis]